ncbi:hypothetical protein MMC14_004097 [Varicellaria rhodocarpa]|nr:hypothetical protein [Varicellaria rhodocarpa]
MYRRLIALSALLVFQILFSIPATALPNEQSSPRESTVNNLSGAIGSILGAYVGLTLLVVTFILTIGRRLRRSAQTSPRTLAMELVKPIGPHINQAYTLDASPDKPSPWDPSPVSTVDTKQGWPSPNGLTKSHTWGSIKKGHKQQTSVQSSVITFDDSVIEGDKAKNEIEMERLYAAVMEHDEQTNKLPPNVNTQPLSQHPPELQHLRYAPPREQPMSPPLPPLPMKPNPPPRTNTASPKRNGSRLSRPSPISVAPSSTHSRASSRSSLGSLGKSRGIRSLAISPPMGSPDLDPDNLRIYGESEPLTPRYYTPGPPPTPPQRHMSNASDRQYQGSMSSPRSTHFPSTVRTAYTSTPQSPPLPTPRSARNPTFELTPESPVREEAIESPFPNPSPQRQLSSTPKSTRVKPAPLPIRTDSGLSITTNRSIPLRSTPLPLRNINTNLATTHNERPPSMIKATVLERKAPEINHLRTPMTGVPMTPYSPYMPFTPLTPVTPSRLVTREERKKREKEEGRRVLTRDDVVIEEGAMWGDAYHR